MAHDPEITGSRPLGRQLPCPFQKGKERWRASDPYRDAPARIFMYAASTYWSRESGWVRTPRPLRAYRSENKTSWLALCACRRSHRRIRLNPRPSRARRSGGGERASAAGLMRPATPVRRPRVQQVCGTPSAYLWRPQRSSPRVPHRSRQV